MTAVLIATLGAEPQVIALATQLLHQQSPLAAVVVLHTDPKCAPVQQALPAVQHMFAEQSDWPALYTQLIPVSDILTPDEFEQFTTTLYTVIRHWLTQGCRIHLLLAGGRKSMAMLGMSVAQLLLGPEDRVWYLYSEEGFRQTKQFLLSDHSQAKLIPIPLPQQSAAPPLFRRFFQAETPAAAHQSLLEEQATQVHHFIEVELTAAEREVAILVAQDVLTVKEIAAQLHKSPKTVTNQLNTIYSKLESYFGLQPDVGVKREFLRRALVDWVE